MARLTITCISCVIIVLMFAGQSFAQVDRGTIVGIWLFDEGSGEVAQDSSENGNDGTLKGPKWTNQSKFGSALEFNGAGSYIEFATGQSMKTPHFTIMAWFNTRKLNGYGHIFQTGNDWNDMAGYVLRVHQEGTIQAGLAFGPGNKTTFVTGPTLKANTWYHTALTYDGTTATLYLDGKNIASSPGQGAIMYDTRPVRIGILSSGTGSAFDGFIDEVALFNEALEPARIEAIMNDGLADIAGNQPFASRPSPKDGAQHLDTWVTLSWKPGNFAASHDVYLGDKFDDVNGATRESKVFRGNQTADFYIAGFPGFAYPDGLVPGTTYYWRIDEVNQAKPESPWKGGVWSFSVPPKKAYNPAPADGAESVVLNAKLTWTAGFGAKIHTVYFGENRDTVANAAGGLPQGTTSYTPTGLKMAKTYYWRVDEFDGMTTYKGDVWSFTTTGAVGNPSPADGAVGVSTTMVLTWRAGGLAASHEVYFGTNADAVKNATKTSPEYKGPKALGDESYDPGKLLLETTYYWRIEEVNTLNPDSPWKGNVWSFTTGNFLVLDDFESYDAGANQIWYAWHDGLGYGAPGTPPYFAGNGTGAAVGDETTPSFTEETIVHGGKHSMPLNFDNNKQGFAKYSEAEFKLTAMRDWTTESVGELSIWFRGRPASVGSFVEGPVGTYTITAAGADIWNQADQFHYAYKTLSGVGSIEAQVLSVDNTDPWAKAGVMIRETLDAGSKFAAVYITPGNGCRFQARIETGIAATSDSAVATTAQTAIKAPYWVKIERDAAGSFRGYYSSNGTTWTSMAWNPQSITTALNVYVGLALTSHNNNATCTAKFSNVKTTGTVGAQWANQDIGIASNAAEPLFVAISNAGGQPAVVVHPNPKAAQIAAWTEWVIPLSSLQGITLTNVDKLAIGLGTRGNTTTPGGSGKMYIDDIRLYRARTP